MDERHVDDDISGEIPLSSYRMLTTTLVGKSRNPVVLIPYVAWGSYDRGIGGCVMERLVVVDGTVVAMSHFMSQYWGHYG